MRRLECEVNKEDELHSLIRWLSEATIVKTVWARYILILDR